MKNFFHRLSGEKKFFTATRIMRWKKIFQRYHEAVKKNFSPLKSLILQKFTAKLTANLTKIHRYERIER